MLSHSLSLLESLLSLHTHIHTPVQSEKKQKGSNKFKIFQRIVSLLTHQTTLGKQHFNDFRINESETYGLNFP